jgi:hypothetical protein
MQMFLQRCPVCLNSAGRSPEEENDIATIDCPQCGRFQITNDALRELTADRVDDAWARSRAEMSAWISRNPEVSISSNVVADLFGLPTSPLLERVARLMALVEQATSFLGQEVDLPARRIQGVSSSVNEEEIRSLLSYARSRGWVAVDLPPSSSRLPDRLRVRLTTEGLIELDGKRAGVARLSRACVAMGGDGALEDAYIRGTEKAIRTAGYEPVALLRASPKELPDDTVAAAIRGCRFVVIDASLENETTYYEAGFAAALKLPVIWTCREDARERLPAGAFRATCIFWNSPEELRDRLTSRIVALLGAGPVPPQG